MKTSPSTPENSEAKAPTLLACVILISGTKIGNARYAKNHPINLPSDQAKALAELNPPAVRIDGIPS